MFFFILEGTDEQKVKATFQVNPNPATAESQISIFIPAAGKWSLELFDMAGISVKRIPLDLNSGFHALPLTTLTGNGILPSGNYILSLTGSKGAPGILKIILKN
jgi:hypothetical protein